MRRQHHIAIYVFTAVHARLWLTCRREVEQCASTCASRRHHRLGGVIRLKDMEDCVEGIMTPATLSYRKLVDMTEGSPALSRDDILTLGERVREHAGAHAMGALAVAAVCDESHRLMRLFKLLSVADRPMKSFGPPIGSTPNRPVVPGCYQENGRSIWRTSCRAHTSYLHRLHHHRCPSARPGTQVAVRSCRQRSTVWRDQSMQEHRGCAR